jgi:hypothetical protein
LGKPKVSLTFVLDVNSLARVVKAEAQFIEKVEVQVPVKQPKVNETETLTIEVEDKNATADAGAASNETVKADADTADADKATTDDEVSHIVLCLFQLALTRYIYKSV